MRTNDWWQRLFAAVDAKDTQGFVDFLTPDCEFQFGNAPPAHGQAAVAAAVDGFFGTIRASRHVLLRTFDAEDACACQGTVTYTRLDGRELTLPFANFFELRNGQIARYQIYIDIAPLYAG